MNIINRFKEVHGDKYDYRNVIYTKMINKVEIICHEHGSFYQTPHSHLKGQGCPECAKVSRAKKRTNTTDNFIKRAKEIHGEKYDYSKVEYLNNRTKVCIICPEHGEFWQRPNEHLNGRGCHECAKERNRKKMAMPKDVFIERCKEIYGDKYDYSKVEYVNNHTKVCIICPEHGEFWQIPSSHLQGKGCPKCGVIMSSLKKNERANKEFNDKAKNVHGDKYDYSHCEYIDCFTPIKIKCPIHGFFSQAPTYHLSGFGCPKCGIETVKSKLSSNNDDFIAKCKEVHGEKYNYSKTEYVNKRTKVCIICPEHGEFWQRPDNHLGGHGCPKCSKTNSKVEDEIADIIKPLEYEQNNRSILNGKEIDIYIPSLKLGIEYNGLRWHSEQFGKDRNYHIGKLNECNEKGIKLIQIFEDEWINRKDIVISKIRHIANIDTNKKKIFARKCNIKEVNKEEAKDFLNKNHIQGYVGASVYLGLFYENELIGLMGFKKEKDGYWDLNRFATDNNYNCVGAGGKLFKYFIKNYDFKEIKSFADRRWTTNPTDNLYTKLGFECVGFLSPDYRYFIDGDIERHHKFGFRKQILHKKYGLPLTMTENEMAKKLGFYKIWDCGLIKYVYKNEAKID